MSPSAFPLAYRWFLARSLIDWQPWYFIDSNESIQRPPDFSRYASLAREFKLETQADFDVYLFARRQDCDDFAYFVVDEGVIQDQIVTMHLSFSGRLEMKAPLTRADVKHDFTSWIRHIVVPDVQDWMSEADMYD